MWKDLPENEKEEYKRMILAFASLTELFSQKNEENDEIPAPIINSKYQETIFQKAFHASAEDIGNTSYDVAINGKNIGNRLKTAFVKIENIYQIKRYDIFLLSDKQIIKVAQKYKIVQKLWDAKGYVQLLRSPFYLNLLVKQMFNCLLYRGQQGIITKVSSYLKKYLQQNEKIAQLFFYTIIAIAEDQMACYKYNVNKLCGIGEKIDYQPNRKKPPVWVKRIFEKNGIDLYNSKREEIIQKYLIREKKKDLSTWNIENGDLQTLCYVSNCGLSFDNHEFSMIMRKIFPYLLSIISNVEDYDEFIDVYAVDEVITFISNGLCDKDSSAIVDMLFDLPDFGQMSSDGYELYEEIAAHLLAVYFDAYKNIEIRRKCEVTLLAIEDKISHICELEVRNNLCKMMFLTLGKIHMHDWNELHTVYSYKDKMFLNEIWSKYGWLHFKNLLYVINQMHITELLPEIILPLNESLRKCGENYADCKEMIKANAVIINKIITKAFLDFNDDIKCDHELVKAFEEVLETLVGFGMEEAAVILDEFRVH